MHTNFKGEGGEGGEGGRETEHIIVISMNVYHPHHNHYNHSHPTQQPRQKIAIYLQLLLKQHFRLNIDYCFLSHQLQVNNDLLSKSITSVHKVLPFPRHVTFLI